MLLLLLGVLFVAIAAGSYPIVRRLTRRLEALKRGVDRFGAGQLSHRVEAAGDDEVAALAGSFNQAAQRIEDLVRSNRSLLANASHELRSPLARLKMAVAMSETAAPAQRQALKTEIDRDIRELDALVDEVLLASRLDAHTSIAADPVDLLALCAEEAMHVGAALDVAEPPAPAGAAESWQLRGDERLLRRALRNLLENACRYGGEAIELHLRADAEQLSAAVCDRGPGVPPEERERIFEPFYRMPGHAERAGGVGLGLSLVRQIAARHSGRVECDAREGGGSCFTLSLPRLARPAPHSG
jgi:signal transduction histidine kinase